MRSLGSGNWKCVGYLRANSAPFAFPILAPAGTEGAPSYSFADDSNSGFYSSGTDEVSLTLGGTDRVTFSTSLMTIATDVLVDNDALRFVAGNDPLYQTTLDITSSLSANRTLSINAGDANHTLDISGAPTNVVIASGTYTPTLTNVANVAASVANAFRWLRVGNTVWVDGILTVDPTTTATLTTVDLSLPVASNFASSAQLSGVGAAYTIANEAWGFSANATDDRATMQCICATASNHAVSVAFSYQVI